jgi:hypothetical protein
MYVQRTIYSRLPEDEALISKHVEDIKQLKIKILIRKCAFRWFKLYKLTSLISLPRALIVPMNLRSFKNGLINFGFLISKSIGRCHS